VDDAKVSALAQHSGTKRAEELTVMGWKFETINLAASVDALEKFDSEVGKILKKEMRAGANEVAKAARKRIPNSGLSNWGMWTSEENGRDLGFIGSWVKRGIVVETKRSRNRGSTVALGYRVVTKSVAGAIYELAGGSTKGYRGRRLGGSQKFRQNIRDKNNNGPYPRTLFPAYYEAMPKAIEKIEAAIRKAEPAIGKAKQTAATVGRAPGT
jgi:hypothetical protein